MSESRTPEQIKADIEHTREELADTAAALADKADVKARAQEKVDETKARVTEKVEEARSKVTATASTAKAKAADATPESVATGAQSAAGSVADAAKARPLPTTLIVSFGAGVLVGWIIWSRRG
jgi:F0F1-type ATP synthase membrane subunit b/b'